MKWFKENWPKATIFLAVYITLLLVLFVREERAFPAKAGIFKNPGQ